MKKLLKTKWFIVLAVSLLLIAGIILSFVPGSPLKAAVGLASNAVSPAQKGVKTTGNAFSNFWSALTDGIAIREENKALKEEIADLKYRLNQYEEAAIRYEELKGAFHIRDTFSNYDIYGATILSREADEWFSVIRINAGKNEGIVLEQGRDGRIHIQGTAAPARRFLRCRQGKRGKRCFRYNQRRLGPQEIRPLPCQIL